MIWKDFEEGETMRTPTREEFERKTRPYLRGFGLLISLAELYHLTKVRLRESARPVLYAFSAFFYASLLSILFSRERLTVSPAMMRLAEEFRILSACVFAGMAVLAFLAGLCRIGARDSEGASPGKSFAADLLAGVALCLFAAGSILISYRICDSFSLTGRLSMHLLSTEPVHLIRDLFRLEDIVEGEWKWVAVLLLLNALIFSGTMFLAENGADARVRIPGKILGLITFGILADLLLVLLGMLILPDGPLNGLIPSPVLKSTPLLILIFLFGMTALAAVLYRKRRERI